MMLRTLRFWVRATPRKSPGERSKMVQRIYRTKAEARKARRPGEQVVQATAHILSPH